MIKMYAIPNCDTVKKVRSYLELKKITYEFYDYKKMPPTKNFILKIYHHLNDYPINKKGPTFRKYKDEFENLDHQQKIELMIEFPSMIKRPIIEKNDMIVAIGLEEAFHYFK